MRKQELLRKIGWLEWKLKRINTLTHLLIEQLNLEIVYNKNIYKQGTDEDEEIFGLKEKENK